MALAIDSQMAASAGASANATSITFSFTNGAGTFMVVGVSFGNAGAFTVSTITYNGVGLTSQIAVGYDGATHNFSGAALFSILSPATGANNVVVTMTGAGGGTTSIEAGAITFTGNDMTTPIVAGSTKSNFLESNTTSATVVSGTTTVGNIVLAQMATGSGYSSAPVGTLSWSKNASSLSAGGNGAMTRAAGTGSTITMTDTITSDFFGMVCLEVAAAGGGGGGSRGLFRTPAMSGLGGGGSFFRDPLAAPMQMVRRDRIFVPAWMGAAA